MPIEPSHFTSTTFRFPLTSGSGNTVFIDGSNVLQSIADSLQKDVASLNERWGRIVTRAIQFAIAELNNILRSRGYTDAQIGTWDDGPLYGEMLALFFSWVNGSGLADVSDRDYSKLDCRDSLRKMLAISIGGQMVGPAQSGTGSPAGSGVTSVNGIGGGDTNAAAAAGCIPTNPGQVAEFNRTMYFPSERNRGCGCNRPDGFTGGCS